MLELATAKERAELNILRPLGTEEHASDWRDLGDHFFSPTYNDNMGSGGIVSRYKRPSRRTRPTAADRRAEAKTAARITALKEWRVREAALPSAITEKQRAAMKAHALGETIPAIAARLGVGQDAVKDRIRRGEYLEKRHEQKAMISSR